MPDFFLCAFCAWLLSRKESESRFHRNVKAHENRLSYAFSIPAFAIKIDQFDKMQHY